MTGRVIRQWTLKDPDEAIVRELVDGTGLSPTSARILANRGVTDPREAESFLSGSLSELASPFLMKDMEKAAGRLAEAGRRGEPVLVYADYDVDGATGAAVLYLFLKDVFPGLPVRIHQNHRLDDGYGLREEHLRAAAADGFRLVVTVDCGISDVDVIGRASAEGMTVIVTDHHLPGDTLPPAFAVLNPRRADCTFPEKDLAGVGVAFLLACGVRARLREDGHFEGASEPVLRRYLDLVALGTVADMVPLRRDNRILVREGLKEMRQRPRTGLRALMEASRVEPGRVTETDLGFRLAPRINAAGRLGDPLRSSTLLTTSDEEQAYRIATDLSAENGRRQREEERILSEALAAIARGVPPGRLGAIVLAGEDWHMGVLGIVASKLVDRFWLPTVMLRLEDGEAKGSCRSVEGFPIVDALSRLSGLLTRYGGHRQAAGLSLPVGNLDAFREGFGREAREWAAAEGMPGPRIEADARVRLSDIHFGLMEEWERLRPFGMGNPEPVLLADDLRIERISPFGADDRHLRLDVAGCGTRFETTAFNRTSAGLAAGDGIDLLFTPQVDVWRGNRMLRLLLRDLRMSASTHGAAVGP